MVKPLVLLRWALSLSWGIYFVSVTASLMPLKALTMSNQVTSLRRFAPARKTAMVSAPARERRTVLEIPDLLYEMLRIDPRDEC